MKKTVSIMLSLCILISAVSFTASAKVLIRRPYDNYYSTQNPPDFSWPYTHGATYSLKVATNKALTENVIEITGLTKNLYNFSKPFEPGEYYWSYKVNNGPYQAVQRFYIAENAIEFPVSYNYNNIELTLPDNHPRILINSENIHYLKNISTTDTTYKTLKSEVDAGIRNGYPTLTTKIPQAQASSKYTNQASLAARAAILYLTNEDDTYKEYAIGMLKALAVKDKTTGKYLWAPENAFEADSNGNYFTSLNDTYIPLFAYYLGLAYDWMYNDLSAEEKADITGLMESVLKPIYDEWASGKDLDSYNIYRGFVGSHLYRLNQVVIASLAVYDETDKNSYAHKIVAYHLPVMINITHPFSYQDGGNAQGVFYGVNNELNEVSDMLSELGIIDLKDKPIFTNMPYRYIYNWNTGQNSVFGDNYDHKPGEKVHSYHYKTATQSMAATSKNPIMARVAKWLFDDASNYFPSENFYYNSHLTTFFTNEKAKNVEALEPYMLPTSKYFKDIGWVSLNSSLTDDNRISLRFKSSPYGSYNHSHPDQNSFVIDAFGEYIAIDSDYYVSFHDTFDLNWNKKTYAHNAITSDLGVGQTYNDIKATGEITDFLAGTDLDLVTGDATEAYNQSVDAFNKMKRSIIYLKPDVFLIVDDLKTKRTDRSFEFWLNTRGTFNDIEDQSATITEGTASMFVEVLSPEVETSIYEDNFNAPDGTTIPSASIPTAAKNGNDSRICFTTDKTDETKLVTLLSLDDDYENPIAGSLDETEDYLKVIIRDRDTRLSSYVYINKGINATVTDDDISFTGDMAVVTPESVMLVNGTSLSYNNITYFSSDVKISAVAPISGEGRVSLSSIKEDAQITVYTKPVYAVYKTEDENEIKLTEDVNAYGVKYVNDGDFTTFNLYPGTYTFNLNDTLHEGYININITANEGGEIIGKSRIISGTDETFKIIPDDGYYMKSMTFNGNAVTVNTNNEYKTPVLTESAVLNVEFEALPPESTITVNTAEKIFAYDNGLGDLSAIIFGTIDSKGLDVLEYGVLYSYDNSDFKLSDIGDKRVIKLPGKALTANGQFGIEIIDRVTTRPETAYARTYVSVNGNTAYGDIISISGSIDTSEPVIKTLSYEGGIISPTFNPDIYTYDITLEKKNFNGFSYTIPNGATAELIKATVFGDTATITVTSIIGTKKTYTFTFKDRIPDLRVWFEGYTGARYSDSPIIRYEIN